MLFEMHIKNVQKVKNKLLESESVTNSEFINKIEKMVSIKEDDSFYKIAIVKGLAQYDLSATEMAMFDMTDVKIAMPVYSKS